MQALVLATLIIIPGVGNVLLDLGVIIEIDIVDGREIAIENGTTGNQKRADVVHAVGGEVAVTHEIADPFALQGPFFIETGNRQGIGQVDLIHKALHVLDNILDLG